MTTNETLGPSGTVPDRYLEDILADEMSANAPTDETDTNRDARRERNKKRNERCRRLRESLPIQNLAESLNQVESQVHTTPEQRLKSINKIARQDLGMRAGEVITELAEDAYFMRVDNRVTQVPPPRQEPPARQRSHKLQCGHRSQPYSRGATDQPQPYPGIGRWTLSWWQQRRRRRRQP
jgi:hypothetical protein